MFSIGITTFKHRYEQYFRPLMFKLKGKAFATDHEMIIAINGEHKEHFDEQYRENVLTTIAGYINTYPIVFPKFRGLSKLWNSIIIHASEDYVLLLNDDVTINGDDFIQLVQQNIDKHQTSFKMNSSWSHVVLKRSEVAEIGYFDERLLGIGEEDGDFEWRYNKLYGKVFLNLSIPGIINHVDNSHHPTNIKPGIGKYSKFNRDFLFNGIYHKSLFGKSYGMISERLVRDTSAKEQYPYEKFFNENKDKL